MAHVLASMTSRTYHVKVAVSTIGRMPARTASRRNRELTFRVHSVRYPTRREWLLGNGVEG